MSKANFFYSMTFVQVHPCSVLNIPCFCGQNQKKKVFLPSSASFFSHLSFHIRKDVSPLRKNLLITCAALASVCIVTAFLLSFSDLSDPVTPAQPAGENVEALPRTDAEVPSEQQSEQYQYYLREYQGKLAVYLPDKEQPEKVFDLYLTTLPAYDRGQLQMGIGVRDYEQLVQLIEDYIS